jgi:hypothetical protein
LNLKFPVLQSLYQAVNDAKAPRDVGLARGQNFEIPVCVEFLRAFAECVPETFAKLQLGFALRRIAIGKSILADVMDCGDNLL